MQLLEADNVYFATARRRFDHEAELLVTSVALSYNVGSHGHSLHGLNCPAMVRRFIIIVVTHIIPIIIIVSFAPIERHLDFTERKTIFIDLSWYFLSLLLLAEVVGGYGHVNVKLVF